MDIYMNIYIYGSAESVRLRRIFTPGDWVFFGFLSSDIFCIVHKKAPFQWDLIYAHTYLTS